MQLGTTVVEHLLENEKSRPQATGAFTRLFNELVVAAKLISREINRAGLADLAGHAGQYSVHGEPMRKLDIFASDTIIHRVQSSGETCVLASSDHPDLIWVPSKYRRGEYVVVFDPIDSSTNLEANISVGTIFSIFRRQTPSSTDAGMEDVLQPGIKQVAAGYFLYGSSTVMVFTTGAGVHAFTLDPASGEFLLSQNNIRLRESGNIYSINESNYYYWEEGVRRYIEHLKQPPENRPKVYTSRYVGDLVADIHRILLYGGIFLYPTNIRDPRKAPGKLRLLAEASPLALIIEQAGGAASTGRQRILEITPEDLHQRVPLIIGSKNDVKLAEEYLQDKR